MQKRYKVCDVAPSGELRYRLVNQERHSLPDVGLRADVGLRETYEVKVMSMERDTLAKNFADAGARGLIDIKFFVRPDKDTTVDTLRAAVNRSEDAIRNDRVSDFMVNDEGLVASSMAGLLYS